MKIQVRDDKVIIDGYVNAVERFSKPLTNKNGKKFIERIMPSVFQRAIEIIITIWNLLIPKMEVQNYMKIILV